MHPDNPPEGDRIYDLYGGVYRPQILRIALALDVFSPLASGPANAEHIARACQCDIVGARYLLDYLASLGLLAKQGDEYALSPEAAAFLVRGRKSYAGGLIMDFTGPAPWERLAEAIRTGRPCSFDQEVHFAQDAWLVSYSRQRIQDCLEMWAQVGVIPQGPARLRLLDLACGCAIKSLVLAQKSPHLELTCLDASLVLEAARDLAGRWGVSSQVRFVADDLLTAELGENGYEVCLLGQITHMLTAEQNHALYRRIYRALVPGGLLVLDVPMQATSPQDEPGSMEALLLWAHSGGRSYCFDEYRSWLLQAGFATVRQHSQRLLSAAR